MIKFNVFLIIDESAPVTTATSVWLLSINNNAKNNHVILGICRSPVTDDLKLTTKYKYIYGKKNG